MYKGLLRESVIIIAFSILLLFINVKIAHGAAEDPLLTDASRLGISPEVTPLLDEDLESIQQERPQGALMAAADPEDMFPGGSEVIVEESLQRWLGKKVFKQKRSNCYEGTLFISNIACGFSRGAVYYALGEALGQRIQSRDDVTALSVVWGGFTSVAPFALGYMFPEKYLDPQAEWISSVVSKLINGKCCYSEKEDCEKKVCCCNPLEVGKTGFLVLINAISASTFTYLTFKELDSSFGNGVWPLVVINFYTKTLQDYFGWDGLPGMLYNMSKSVGGIFPPTPSIGREAMLKAELTQKILQSKRFFGEPDREEGETDSSYNSKLTGFRELTAEYDRIPTPKGKLLFLLKRELPEINSHQKPISDLEKTLRDIVGSIGAVGLWVYLPLTKEAFVPLIGFLTQDDSIVDQAATGLAATALISASPIFVSAASSSASKLYEASKWAYNTASWAWGGIRSGLESIGCCRTRHVPVVVEEPIDYGRRVRNITAVVLAGFAASQQAEIALESFKIDGAFPLVELTTSTISMFSVFYWAGDAVGEKLWKSIKTCRRYGRSTIPNIDIMRDLSSLEGKISHLSFEGLDALNKLILVEERYVEES